MKPSVSVSRWQARVGALLMTVLASGCYTLSGPMTTLIPKSDFAREGLWLFEFVTAWMVLILISVGLPLAITLFTRHPEKTEPKGEEHHSNALLEGAWTIIPTLILVAIGIPSVSLTFKTQPAKPPADALRVKVIGHQWWWEFQYPKQKIITAGELHLPVGRTVYFDIESADVIHSFWTPMLGGKRDAVPGHTNHLIYTPEATGVYYGQCAEFCGTSHANMRFRVFVDSEEDFQKWTKRQLTPPGSEGQSSPDVEAGQAIFSAAPCTTCHTIEGISKGYIGPNLSHFGSRTTFAGGILENTPENLAKWIHNPEALKPGAQMPALGLTPDETHKLVAFLESLK